ATHALRGDHSRGHTVGRHRRCDDRCGDGLREHLADLGEHHRRREAYRADLDRYRQNLWSRPPAHPLADCLARSRALYRHRAAGESLHRFDPGDDGGNDRRQQRSWFFHSRRRALVTERQHVRGDHSGGDAGLPAQSAVLGFRGKGDEMASRHGCARSNLNMRESKLNGVFFLLALLLVWELAARAEWVNPLIVPAVSKIVGTFSELLWSGQIPVQILASLKRAAVGYALAAAIFIPLGIFMGLFDYIRRAPEVTVVSLRPIPPPVVIPAAMLFFGLEDEMKIFVIFFSCAWPILLNTLDGVRNIDRVLLYT